jgi:pre-mRNA-splicing factor RBM22/SLT11
LEQGGNAGDTASALAHAKLQEMARMEPQYERNLPKLCSFFARGECNRGVDCPFRHEMPRDRNDPMSKQNTKDRFYGQSDPVAGKILGRKRRQEEMEKKVQEEEGYDRARATLYVRFQGEEPYPELTEQDLRDAFYSFGEIVSVRMQPAKGQAFVEYSQPEAAELAIASMNRKELLGRQIYTAWARAPKRGETEAQTKEASETSKRAAPTEVKPLAPPGGASKKPLPAGLMAVKPSAEVAEIAAARKQRQEQLSSVPRPGGGPVRGVGTSAAKRSVGPSKPYYPSSDPSRLGSKASPSSS